jgi:RimJ/RimL family protein N-acetyltransferase
MAYVVERDGAILGIGRYDRIGTIGAEIAFAVADDDQGNGVGTLLLGALVEHATEQGVHKFLAATLADNTTALNIFRRAGFNVQSPASAGEARVDLDLPIKAPETASS